MCVTLSLTTVLHCGEFICLTSPIKPIRNRPISGYCKQSFTVKLLSNKHNNVHVAYCIIAVKEIYSFVLWCFLRQDNPRFPGILARLEEDPICQRLPLTSFLILPFQRITCLKMLVEVFHHSHPNVIVIEGTVSIF